MFRFLACAFALILLVGLVSADDKADLIAWEHEANGIDVKLEFGKEKLVISAFSGENGVIATCKFKIEKDVVKATITKVEEKGNFPAKPKEGLEFSFKWKVEGEKASFSDLKGEGVEEAKAAMEGEYKKKKK